ncbi:hypothetical protein [Thermocrispum municipale]|uniref:hypothetical protein n=1 Tax=Thermocrispum municipale TaxID=37926 RepID=UPI000402A030|nr:hypothetical protein [Thermocrispum municipale]
MGRWTARRTVAVLAVGGVLAAGTFLLGTSGATATTAADTCGGTVSGKMGETITLKSSAVQDAAVKAVRGGFDFPLLPITKSNKTKLRELFEAGKFDPIKLTKVPHAAAGVFNDEKIAQAVVRTIEADKYGKRILAKHGNRDAVLEAVEGHCSDLTVKASNYVAPKQQTQQQSEAAGGSSARAPRDASRTRGTAPEVAGDERVDSDAKLPEMGTGSARAPQRDYGSVPYQLPGIDADDVPDATPYGSTPGAEDIGILGADDGQPQVSNAGNAEQIQAAEGHDRALQLPMLLAVVSLACVAAALVRTWVLRRV